MNLCSKRLLVFAFLCFQHICAFPLNNEPRSTYDQRQSGKYNIHISLKDVAIIEVDKNEFVDETMNNADEYYYDDDDLTVKPISLLVSPTVKTTPLINTSTTESMDAHIVINKLGNEIPKLHHNISTSYIGVGSSSLTPKHSSVSITSTESSISFNANMPPVLKPVMNNLKESQDNIPQHMESFRHIVPYRFSKKRELNTRIIDIQKYTICKRNYLADSNGNCHRNRRLQFLKRLFNIIPLMQVLQK